MSPIIQLENLETISSIENALKLAYRKAKVDLYYSNDARSTDLVAYEAAFDENMASLAKRLSGSLKRGSNEWAELDEFIGGFSLIAKRFDETTPTVEPAGSSGAPTAESKKANFTSFHADGEQSASSRGTADFRILSRCSIDMHVVSALWLGTVGAKLEAALGIVPEGLRNEQQRVDLISSSYGDRLRRTGRGDYNWYSPGSFKSYLHQYRNWQSHGFRRASEALDRGESIVAVTADFKSFFPSLGAGFLLEEHFLELSSGTELTREEQRLNELLVVAFQAWRRAVQKELDTWRPSDPVPVGLPMGLPASGLVANIALAEFDRTIRSELAPLFYGRYVDDLMLVIPRSASMERSIDVWRWIETRFRLREQAFTVEEGEEIGEIATLSYEPRALKGTKLTLSPEKTRCFFLKGQAGKLLIASIEQTARERTSEWRALPDIPLTAEAVATRILNAMGIDGEAADGLRSVHSIGSSRAGFALRLRDYEALAKDLPSEAWESHRAVFFETVAEYVYRPTKLFDFERYVPRLIQLAILTSDWAGLRSQLVALRKSFRALLVMESIDVRINGESVAEDSSETVLRYWFRGVEQALTEAARRSASATIPKKEIEHLEGDEDEAGFSREFLQELETASEHYARLFASDLAAVPIRSLLLSHEWRQATIPEALVLESLPCERCLPERLESDFDALIRLIETGHSASPELLEVLRRVSGFQAPTRPMNACELLMVSRAVSVREEPGPAAHYEEQVSSGSRADLLASVRFLRGYSIGEDDLLGLLNMSRIDSSRNEATIRIPRADDEHRLGRAAVAIAAIRTTREQLSQALHGSPDLSLPRYRALCGLANSLIGRSEQADLLVCPELSIPREWFSRIAFKLHSVGTSLIAGVEYGRSQRHPTGVTNQVWASFAHRAWGFRSSIVYMQDKQRPSRGEERNLLAENASVLRADDKWTKPPIVDHRGMLLSVLICSELTNLEHRAHLRARIDALIVPEWNQDVRTFASIIESAAFDMHVYVVQANNRTHGDSRIRAPYREEWRRDIVKVSGGLHDHVLVGEIDIQALRRFQSKHDDPQQEFKSLPDGFKISTTRNIYPISDTESPHIDQV